LLLQKIDRHTHPLPIMLKEKLGCLERFAKGLRWRPLVLGNCQQEEENHPQRQQAWRTYYRPMWF